MTVNSRVLIVEDSVTQRVQMETLFGGTEYEVLLAVDGIDALEVLETNEVDAVVTDLQMPRMNGLELVAEIKSRWPRLPVVLTTAVGSETIASEALSRGATSYVSKAFMCETLVETVRQVVCIKRAGSDVSDIDQCVSRLTMELELPNNESLVPNVIAKLEQSLTEVGLFDEMVWTQVAMALDEAILNAMLHGNLEVSSDLREEGDGQAFWDLIKQRQTEPEYSGRRVYVSLTASRTQAVFVIRDEGPGFDVASLPDPTDPANLERASGRGLLLINAFMDEVHHNDSGNELSMTKRKAGGSSADDE